MVGLGISMVCKLKTCTALSLAVGGLFQVRYARSHQYVQAGSGPEDNRQLFFARAPSSATEEQVTELFSRFGEVRTSDQDVAVLLRPCTSTVQQA